MVLTALAAAVVLTAAATVGGVSAAHAATQAAEVGSLVIHSQAAEVATSAEPRLVTVSCADGEQLVSGGYATNRLANVVSSYPSDPNGEPVVSGAEPRAWTLGVVNSSNEPVTVRASAACLAGGTGRSQVQVDTQIRSEASFSVAVACPPATVRTGGGYSSQWEPVSGRAAITGTYPLGDNQWSLDVTLFGADPDVSARATVSTYAVCHTGDALAAPPASVPIELDRGQPECGDGPLVICRVPRSGSGSAGCQQDQILSGGGYRLRIGSLPVASAVQIDAPSMASRVSQDPAWSVAVLGESPTDSPITVEIIALCLVAAATGPTTPATTAATPPVTSSPTDTNAITDLLGNPVATGSGVLVALALLGLAVLALRHVARRGRRRAEREAAAGSVTVVVRSHGGRYRLDRFRETP